MPRIRDWKHLILYRSDKDTHYEHIDGLFTGAIDWELIATHLPDMCGLARQALQVNLECVS